MIENCQNQIEKKTTELNEKEVELIDYLFVVWKYKYMILTGIVLFGLVAGIISIIQPKMFLAEMVIQPGIRGIDKQGHEIYIDSLQNIKALIEGEIIFDHIKTSNTPKSANSLDFKVNIPNGTNILRVSHISKSADEGIEKLNLIIKALKTKYTKLAKIIQNEDNIEIESRKNEITVLYAEEKKNKFIVNNIEIRIDELKSKAALYEKNADMLAKQINKMTKIDNQNSEYQILLGTNIIMQSMRLRNEYRDKIHEYFSKREEMKIELFRIHKDIDDIKKNIQNIEENKQIIKPVEIKLYPPTKLLPNKNYRMKQRVILSAFVGFFLTIFLAFFIEYIRKYKKNANTKNILNHF